MKIEKVFCGLAMVVFSFILLPACSYSPGLKVSDTISSKNILNTEFEKPIFYQTKTGLKVRFENLNANNLPVVKNVSDNSRKNIEYLLRQNFDRGDYIISPSDELSLNFWAYKDIFSMSPDKTTSETSIHRVSKTGYVYLPMVGKVKAANKTEEQLRSELRKKFSRYLKYPDIDVKVIKYEGKSFTVLGSVNKPGQILMTSKAPSLITAIGKAGGFSNTADVNSISIVREGKRYSFGLSDMTNLGISSSSVAVLDGDIISIAPNDGRKVYVFGEVIEPKEIMIPQTGMSLSNVIGGSGGLNPQTSSASKIYVVRDLKTSNITNVYRLDLSNIENLALADRFQMLPSDTVYVDATGLSKFNRILSALVPSTNSIKTGQSLGAIK